MEELFPYTPRKTKFEVLEATFVARQSLLDELKTTIKEQATVDTLQHWMVLGTRGMGKSHIITMVYHIVKNEPSYNTQWLPVLMNEEEQGVFSLPSLFVRIVTKLADELDKTDKEKAKRVYACLEDLRRERSSPENVLENSIAFLKDFVTETGKRLLVLVENADDLFTKCMPNKNEVKKFRKMLQHENYLLLIATSPTFFEGIKSRKGVLYDFFRTRRLDLLSYEESLALLRKWAKVSGDNELLKEFVPDDYRLRVLYHLTGGNPRILMFLYMAISEQKKMKNAVTTFRTLLENDLNNYYLSRLRDIPNQEQPIVIALAESSRNMTQTEIGAKTFLPTRSIGTFMVRLENAGLVRPVTDKKGKNTLYTLTDHMFRLWYQWRTSLREKNVIEAIVEFLSIWYKRHELESWARSGGIYADHAREALMFRETEKFKEVIEVFHEGGKEALFSYLTDKNYHAAMDTMDFLKECGIDTSDIEPSLLEAINKCETLENAEECYLALTTHHVDNAKVYWEIGRIFIKKEKYSQAEEALIKAVELDPKDVEAWKFLGHARSSQKNYTGADEALSKAVELDPKEVEAWKFLGHVRNNQDNFTGAEEAYAKAVELNPKDAAAWNLLGGVRNNQDNFAGAEEASLHMLDLEPNNSDAWRLLGCANCKRKNFTEAKKAFSHAIELNPKNSDALKRLGHVFSFEKNYIDAEEVLSRAIEVNSKDSEGWILLGRARSSQKNYTGAEEALSKAVELNPKDAETWRFLGSARHNQENYAGAEEALSKAVELNPKDAETWRFLGSARHNQENYAGAEEVFTKAVELDLKDAKAWRNLGGARNNQGNYAGAEEALIKALELDPKDAETWRFLGSARHNQENYAGAEEVFTKAVELDPKDAKAWRSLGGARHNQENYAGAEEAFTKAVELDPANVDALKFLSMVNFMNYHYDDCINITLKGLKLNSDVHLFFDKLCELDVRVRKVPNLLVLFERYLQSDNTDTVSKTYLYFYRALVFLHGKDVTPFKADLQTGIVLMKALDEEDRRTVQGKLIDFLKGVIYGDYLNEIKTYIETIKEIAPEIAQLFSPLSYVIEYFEAYSVREGKKLDREKALKRAETALDRVPMELRGPVEEMIQTVRENMEWWKKRPKKLR
jgi:cytochrome c-type biogenesis protein CcmH/NrfG